MHVYVQICVMLSLFLSSSVPGCRDQVGRAQCPIDPYFIVPDKCKCVDFQMLKMQESPDAVPNGELPRHIQLFCDRYLTDRVVPGNRITVLGIYSIKKVSTKAGKVGDSCPMCGVLPQHVCQRCRCIVRICQYKMQQISKCRHN